MNDKLETRWAWKPLPKIEDLSIDKHTIQIDKPIFVSKDPRKKLMKIKNVRKLKKNKRIVIINKQVKQI